MFKVSVTVFIMPYMDSCFFACRRCINDKDVNRNEFYLLALRFVFGVIRYAWHIHTYVISMICSAFELISFELCNIESCMKVCAKENTEKRPLSLRG